MSERAQRRGLGMADVKPLLQQRALELARQFLPNGRSHGTYWHGDDPAGGHDNFTIWIKGPAAGGYKSWSGDVKGDVFDLLIYFGQARDRKEALRWAKGYLGLAGADPARVEAVKVEARKRSAKAEAEAAAKREKKARYAKAIWLEAELLAPGLPAWRYLAGARGIPIQWLTAKRPMGSLRYHPKLAYHWGPADRLDPSWQALRPKSGLSHLPAIVAAMSPVISSHGEIGDGGGLHRTYIQPDGLGKANVPNAKRMLGAILGCAGKLWRGESGLPERTMVERGLSELLVVTEGLEDALSVAVSMPEARVWFVGSLAGLGALPYPAVARELVIFADNDWNKPAAERQLDQAVNRLAKFGTVRVTRAAGAGVKDANDLLKTERT